MIFAFLAGAGVLGIGVSIGASLVRNSYDRILKSAPVDD